MVNDITQAQASREPQSACESQAAKNLKAGEDTHKNVHASHDATYEHVDGHMHHHHTHAQGSHHVGGHHLLQVEDLNVGFMMYDDDSHASLWRKINASKTYMQVIYDLSIAVHQGEIVAVVGASGSGKTLLADAILGISPENACVSGRIWFDGKECTAKSLAALRGDKIAFVPQSVEAFDPLMKVGRQVEAFANRAHSKVEACAMRKKIFERYGLDDNVARLYPFELSGGMARRVLLACALINEPQLIIADEPTPGLDLELAVQAMQDLRNFANNGGSVLLITHDIELVLRVADRIAVFHDGTIVEETAVSNFSSPDLLSHPFTKELWHALPEHGFTTQDKEATC